MMLFRCVILFLFLFIVSVASFPQSTNNLSIVRENDLLPALLSIKTGDQSKASTLLTSHKDLITRKLCDGLLQAATLSSGFGNSSRSLFLFKIAKEAAEHLGDRKLLAFAFYKLGQAHFDQDNIKTAIDHYLQSKKLFEEAKSRRDLVYILSELGALQIYAADYKKAKEYSEESLALAASLDNSPEPAAALPDEYGIAFAWFNLGRVAKWEGDYNTAISHFQRSLEMWKELKQREFWSTGNIVDALTEIAHVYQATGDHLRAFNYLSQAMTIAKRLLNRNRMAGVLNDIGVLYIEQGDYLKASESLNRSLQIFTELNNRREVARNLLNTGVINYRQGNHKAALEKFQKSLEKAQEIDVAEVIIAAEEGLGAVYQAQGNYQMALGWFDKAWSLAEKIGDKIRMTELLWRKGQVFFSQRDYVRSGELASSAAELATQLRLPLMTYLTLALKGQSYHAQNSDGLASESFIKSIEAVEHMRAQIAGGEREQQLFFEDKISPYHGMVSLLIEQNDAGEALKYAERAKARVLLDVLRNGRIVTTKSLTDSEKLEEQRLYSEMVSLNSQIRVERMRQQPEVTHVEELETRLQRVRTSYEALQASLYSAHPALKAKRGLFSPFSLNDALPLIPDNRTALLEYVVTEEQTILFVLTRSLREQAKINVAVYPIRIKKGELATLVDDFRKLLAVNHPGFRKPGERLYDLLIKPAEQFLHGKTALCIVPDGVLWELPFQALQTGADKYLLELYALYYAPSLQVLGEMKKRATSLHSSLVSKGRLNGGVSSPELYAIGNPEINGEVLARIRTVRNTPFVTLPETEREVQTISTEVYGQKASIIHVGAAAREDVVKAEMGNYRVVHFATHGVLNDHSPLYSYLLLAPGDDSREDGLLEAWELMQMNLKAEMVVLSACDTARGNVGTGEGMIGMTWALFVAGVPTTIASQWKVPSETTTKLMVTFHKFAKDSAKAEAWRQAALEMIRDPRYRMKPFYWAGFVVVGNGDR